MTKQHLISVIDGQTFLFLNDLFYVVNHRKILWCRNRFCTRHKTAKLKILLNWPQQNLLIFKSDMCVFLSFEMRQNIR